MSPTRPPAPLLALGLAAFALAALSIVDMYLPRPYDGVVLEAEAPAGLTVGAVVPGSGAARAGIAPGDRIVGIGRTLIESKAHAAAILNEREIGETVAYLVRRSAGAAADGGGELVEVAVALGRRQIGDTSYLYACVLGFSFFFIGLFVLLHQPRLRSAQVFFLLCSLFLLFLVCRLRPASYSWVDGFVLHTGTAALLLLPAAFLHFFLIFPRPVWDGHLGAAAARLSGSRTRATVLAVLYLLPVAVFALAIGAAAETGAPGRLISGAPVANWWVLAVYVVAALAVLAANRARLPDSGQRRGATLVLAGSLVGWLPFLVTTVAFPSFLHTEEWIFTGVVPLAAIPLTFAYAIFRFQLLDVRVILRKSLLYTGTTAVVTVLYALGIASFNAIFRGTELAEARYFPLLFALAIVLLFEPLRRRIQGPMDRFFFAERTRLQRVMIELGEGFAGGADPAAVVRERVAELPRLLGLRFAALYLCRGEEPEGGGAMERVIGPAELPERIAPAELLVEHLRRRGGGVARLDDLDLVRLRSPAVDRQIGELAALRVAVIGLLASSRRRLGLVLLGAKEPRVAFEAEELELLSGVFHQAAIALETSHLLEARARQAELERELEIASAIQAALLPRGLDLGAGWRVAAACKPARHVGGDFYAALPGPAPGRMAVVWGDVSGKSVSGALMMMAASEVLHALALSHREPEELFRLANRRLYDIADRSFVALGYFTQNGGDGGLRYLLAGQPQPLKRTAAGAVEELPLPEHRLPLGALCQGGHRGLEARLDLGELLLAYSDGVVDAQDPAGEPFGQERLAAVLAGAAPEPQAVVDAVLAALDDFTRGEPAYDDVTLLAIGRPRAAETDA